MRIAGLLPIVLVVSTASSCDRADTTPVSTDAVRQKGVAPADRAPDLAYVCPMDRDIRSTSPGKCSRCGMLLVAGIPDQTEYHLDLSVAPKPAHPRETVHLTFEVFDPWKHRRVEKFSVVHEKLFHAFVVSRDLQFFLHDHPTWRDGAFHYDMSFPKPGLYRVLGDFYPEAASPQLITDTIFVAGPETTPAPLVRDYSTKATDNLKIDLYTTPAEPIAGVTTELHVGLTPADGLERYLGAWGHMLAASSDLIDMIHTHPTVADGGPQMQFNLVFPRTGVHRVWVQFQRQGIVNTAHFDIPARTPVSPSAPAN